MSKNAAESADDSRELSHEDEAPSRSQRRREALAVFELARALVQLPEARLAQLPLSDELRARIVASRRITSHIARKRQLQFLAKHMRRLQDELEPIRAQLAHDRAIERRATAELHRLERQRDALIAGGDDAITELVLRHPAIDRQKVRQLVRRARAEAAAGKPPAASRALFRLLRELVTASGASRANAQRDNESS